METLSIQNWILQRECLLLIVVPRKIFAELIFVIIFKSEAGLVWKTWGKLAFE